MAYEVVNEVIFLDLTLKISIIPDFDIRHLKMVLTSKGEFFIE